MNTPGYQVLARKYRPARFDDLIGQEPMVRTLRNAFKAGRIAHAWMLTGVRGVGKTTTARILARGLNYSREGDSRGDGEPTIDLPEKGGAHCQAIMEGRHPDVIEMDAASHTGIDDIRDIIDSARYSPVSARYKVYIIDEVHMLSKAAFNGLLKTLEEPPEHVKFIFATTEVRRVPVTVLSRCQRFDLRRVEPDVLTEHLKQIAGAEKISCDDGALALIVRAAEGSVRDALSILDQAIAHGAGNVAAETVHDMLGLADRARIIDLFDHVMRGDTRAALTEWQDQYETGADAHTVLADLAEFTHLVTRLKLAPDLAHNPATAPGERERGTAFAESLSLRALSRCWQMLLKGLEEVAQAPNPAIAADMVLVRLCHAADLPTPDEALRQLKDQDAQGGAERATPAPELRAGTAEPVSTAASVPAAVQDTADHAAIADRAGIAESSSPLKIEPRETLPHDRVSTPADDPPDDDQSVRIDNFDDLIRLANERRDRLAVFALERHVRPVRCEHGRLDIGLTEDAEPELPQILTEKLREWTGKRWVVAVSPDAESPSVHEARSRRQAQLIEDARSDPLVAGVLEAFPGAEIVDVRERDIEGTGPDAEADLQMTKQSKEN